MIKYLTLEQVLEMHKALVQKFGGLQGIRDANLLAIETPQAAMFGNDLYPTVYDKAAVYLFQIIRNHPFNDSNKRTGFIAAYLFLKANKVPILFEDEVYEEFVVEVAKGKKTKAEIAYFFKHGKEI
jgi:death on curing protein